MHPITQLHSKISNSVHLVHNTKDTIYGKNNSYLQQDIFTSQVFHKVRIVQFTSGNKTLLHSLWYPSQEFNAPILSIDFVQFEPSNKNITRSLLFANSYDYESSEYSQFISRNAFHHLLKKYPEFTEKKTPHLVSLDPILREETMLYTHIYDSVKLEKGIQLLQYYFDAYLTTFLYCGHYINTTKRDSYFNKVRIAVEADFAIYKDLFNTEELNAFLQRGFDIPDI